MAHGNALWPPHLEFLALFLETWKNKPMGHEELTSSSEELSILQGKSMPSAEKKYNSSQNTWRINWVKWMKANYGKLWLELGVCAKQLHRLMPNYASLPWSKHSLTRRQVAQGIVAIAVAMERSCMIQQPRRKQLQKWVWDSWAWMPLVSWVWPYAS